MKMYFILLFLSYCLICSTAQAETVRLKSGIVIDGKITQRTDQGILVDRGVGFPASYYLDDIESIDNEKPQVPPVDTVMPAGARTSLPAVAPAAVAPPALTPKASAPSASTADSPEEFTFRFAPPDGTHFTQEAMQATGMFIEGQPPMQTSSLLIKRGVDIRKTPSGYSVTETTLDVRAFGMNSKEVDPNSPGIGILKGVVLNYELDPNGYVLSGSGGEEFAGKLKEMIPFAFKEGQAQQKQSPQPKPFWAERIGRFYGRTVKVGDVLEETEKMPSIQGAELVFFVKVKVSAKTHCAREPQSCLFITVTKELQNPEAFNVVMDKAREEVGDFRLKNSQEQGKLAHMGEKIAQENMAAVQSKLLGQSIEQKLLIDPATMLIHAEEQTTTFKLEMSAAGETVTGEQKEQMQYIFDYTK